MSRDDCEEQGRKVLGSWLREERERAGFSLIEVAAVSRVGLSALKAIESGRRAIPCRELAKIVIVYNPKIESFADVIFKIQALFRLQA